MRISIIEGDPGYSPEALRGGTKVLLDGVELDDCVTADEELGEVRVYTGFDIMSRPRTEVRRGVVKVVIGAD